MAHSVYYTRLTTYNSRVDMTTITITISDEYLARLQEIASHFNVTAEDLARVGIEELLARPDDAFTAAADYVLQKNVGLYQRLS